jgi:putative transposase
VGYAHTWVPFRFKGEDQVRTGRLPDPILNDLRQAEASVANGKTVTTSVSEFGVTERTFYRQRSEYLGLGSAQVKKLKRLEKENARLKRAVAESTIDDLILK